MGSAHRRRCQNGANQLKERQITAIHEAAHYVISDHYFPDRPRGWLSIIPDVETGGSSEEQDLPRCVTAKHMGYEIIILLAGYYAELILCHVPRKVAQAHACSDITKARRWTLQIGKGLRAPLRRFGPRTRRLVSSKRQQIEKLARALMILERIDAQTCEAILLCSKADLYSLSVLRGRLVSSNVGPELIQRTFEAIIGCRVVPEKTS